MEGKWLCWMYFNLSAVQFNLLWPAWVQEQGKTKQKLLNYVVHANLRNTLLYTFCLNKSSAAGL